VDAARTTVTVYVLLAPDCALTVILTVFDCPLPSETLLDAGDTFATPAAAADALIAVLFVFSSSVSV
jgi:hypothetical protein